MKYAPLGRSGLMVSRICVGGNSWGAKGRRAWAAFGLEESRPFFKRALDLGINFFDTADAYNQGESETIIGECLVSQVKREDIVISTKVGLKMSDRPNDVGLGRKHMVATLDAQLKRLRTDYIDVYQVHRLDKATPIDEFMATLTDMVRSGKVRYVGGSTMPAYKFAQMVMLAELKGYARPIAMQNLYNMIQREEEREMIPLCLEAGVGLIPYSPLARGFLSGSRPRGGGGATERAQKDDHAQTLIYRDSDYAIVDNAKQIAARRGATPSQVALAWMLAKPVTAAPIIGATRLEYLDDAAKAVELALDAQEMAMLESPYDWRVSPAN
ncbi:MAG: aldo/keto reductase [Alphaproteobacteria bacterium]|nr:aldo/keto reductase [Alphaproteobacteria bacterium]